MRTLLIAMVGLVVAGADGAGAEITFDWVTVGDPGNACDVQVAGCFGAVAYTYRISRYEVTNAQYAEFLNAVAATDTHELYNPSMGAGYGGITRSGSSGSYTYSAIAGREDMPVNYVSFYDSLRFANWMHHGQPTGAQDDSTTEDGAYTITTQGITNNTIARNLGALIFLSSEDEWYKAAYYDGVSSYFDYPASSNPQTACWPPGPLSNTANCDNAIDPPDGDLSEVGVYTTSASPYGTFDQGGNVWEWNEAIIGSSRGLRGGGLTVAPRRLAASHRDSAHPGYESYYVGLRVATIPEPGPQLPTLSPWSQLALAGGLLGAGLGVWRWRGASSRPA